MLSDLDPVLVGERNGRAEHPVPAQWDTGLGAGVGLGRHDLRAYGVRLAYAISLQRTWRSEDDRDCDPSKRERRRKGERTMKAIVSARYGIDALELRERRPAGHRIPPGARARARVVRQPRRLVPGDVHVLRPVSQTPFPHPEEPGRGRRHRGDGSKRRSGRDVYGVSTGRRGVRHRRSARGPSTPLRVNPA